MTIILPIENIEQKQNNWCWLSIVEQIILWRSKKEIQQNNLAKIAVSHGAGSVEDVIKLISLYTDLSCQKMRIKHDGDVRMWVEDRLPVILRVATSPLEYHVVLIKGLVADAISGEELYLINDPLRKSGVTIAVSPTRFISSYEDMLVLSEP